MFCLMKYTSCSHVSISQDNVLTKEGLFYLMQLMICTETLHVDCVLTQGGNKEARRQLRSQWGWAGADCWWPVWAGGESTAQLLLYKVHMYEQEVSHSTVTVVQGTHGCTRVNKPMDAYVHTTPTHDMHTYMYTHCTPHIHTCVCTHTPDARMHACTHARTHAFATLKLKP